MQKKKEIPNPRELRDQPVPPVKGAVTDLQDAVLRPEVRMERDTVARLESAAAFDSWL